MEVSRSLNQFVHRVDKCQTDCQRAGKNSCASREDTVFEDFLHDVCLLYSISAKFIKRFYRDRRKILSRQPATRRKAPCWMRVLPRSLQKVSSWLLPPVFVFVVQSLEQLRSIPQEKFLAMRNRYWFMSCLLLFVVLLIVFTNDKLKRRALKAKTFAQTIFDKPQIGKMQKFRLVNKNYKTRRANVSLRNKQNF